MQPKRVNYTDKSSKSICPLKKHCLLTNPLISYAAYYNSFPTIILSNFPIAKLKGIQSYKFHTASS